MVADLVIDSLRSRCRAGSQVAHPQRRSDPAGEVVLLRLVLSAAELTRIERTTMARSAYKRTRNEGFGKLTFTPNNSVLVNFSYRDSSPRHQRPVRPVGVGDHRDGR